jgi:hypothetical protein
LAVSRCICYIASYQQSAFIICGGHVPSFEQYELQFIPQTFTLIAECRKLNAYQGDKEDA